jgi:eukaryotic-like serine/threonine-protein kinase
VRIGPAIAIVALSSIALAQTAPPDVPEEEVPDAAAPTPAPSASPLPPHMHVPIKDGMLSLPGGHFTMGSKLPSAPSNERPAHDETVAPFWIDRTEVTVGAYRACVDQHKCPLPQKTSNWCTYDMGEADLPINCVHWSEADGYCRAMNKRLPRESEWEYAARGTTSVAYPWGGASPSCVYAATLLHDATSRRCTNQRPAKVGSYPAGASAFGVLDLSGNVEEWTSDWYSERVFGGAAPRSGASHVLRGGGWLSGPSSARTTTRDWGSSMEAGPNVGFRCAKSL